MSLFQELHRQGSTIILVTHEPEIARHAQQIVHFRDGHIVNCEKVDQPLNARCQLADWLQQGGLA